MADEMILDTSSAAATFVDNISGWVDRHGMFWGEYEAGARRRGSTHSTCACGRVYRSNSYCDSCAEAKRTARFNALEKKPWDKIAPICLDGGDEYFFDEDSLRDYVHEHGMLVSDLQLRLCRPIKMRELEEEYFLEDLHEDAWLPDDVLAAISTLNDLILAMPAASWEPDRFAVDITTLKGEQ